MSCVLHSIGPIQRRRLPGEEPGHSASRHRRRSEDLGEQTAAAALLQPSYQNRWVEAGRLGPAAKQSSQEGLCVFVLDVHLKGQGRACEGDAILMPASPQGESVLPTSETIMLPCLACGHPCGWASACSALFHPQAPLPRESE